MQAKYLSLRNVEAKSGRIKNLLRKVWPIEWRRSFVSIRLYGEALFDSLAKKIRKFREIIISFQKGLAKNSAALTVEIFNLVNNSVNAGELSNKEFFEYVEQFNNEMSAYVGDIIKALETLEKFAEIIRNYNMHYDKLPGEFRISQRDDRLRRKAVEIIDSEKVPLLREGAQPTIIGFRDKIKEFEATEVSSIIAEAQELVNEGSSLYEKLNSQTIGGKDPRDPKKNMRLQFLKNYFDPETGLIGQSTIQQVQYRVASAFRTADIRLTEIRNIFTLSEAEIENIKSRPKQENFLSQFLNTLKEKRESRKLKKEESYREYKGVVDQTIKQIEDETLKDSINYVKDNNIDLDNTNHAKYIHRVIELLWDRKISKYVSNEELMKELKLDPMIRQRIWLQILDWHKKNSVEAKTRLFLSFRDGNEKQFNVIN